MSEINIILVRHGEASASWSEDPDPGLSKDGINQAKKLCEDKSLKIFIILNSFQALGNEPKKLQVFYQVN